MNKVKICGIKTLAEVNIMNTVKPDYIGYVFAPSKRQVDVETAKQLSRQVHSDIIQVGVFVDATIEEIVAIVNLSIIQMIQLHGSENISYIETLKQHVNVPIIKAITLDETSDFKHLEQLPVDYLLFDSKIAGSGICFDWKQIKAIKKTYFLAGGLHIDNIDEAFTLTNAYVYDISSGVEVNGFKDEIKTRTLVRRIHTMKKGRLGIMEDSLFQKH